MTRRRVVLPDRVQYTALDADLPVATGFNRARDSMGEPAIGSGGGADSGALPDDLGHVVANWPALTDDDRRRIRAIIDGRLA